MTMRRYAFVLLLVGPVAAAQPAPGATPGPPPGSTRATILSTSALQWDVSLGEQPVCATPCQLWVPPLAFVALHSREDDPVRVDVGYLAGGDVTIAVKPLDEGEYAAGVVFTSLSAMGLVTGVSLGTVGFATNSSGLKTAGIVTAVPCAIGLYASIELMRRALPRAQIGPARPYVAGNQVGLAGRF